MELSLKLAKHGNSYGFVIPKALIDCRVLDPSKKYVLRVQEDSINDFKASEGKNGENLIRSLDFQKSFVTEPYLSSQVWGCL